MLLYEKQPKLQILIKILGSYLQREVINMDKI